jgi:hypothetical protein
MGREATRSEVAVPIRLDGRTIGALNLESDRSAAFHAHDVEVLSFYAQAAAIAVEKAMLHERLVEAGRMDRQLKVAQQVQERLLPARPPEVPGHELAASSAPGGRDTDYVPLPDGRSRSWWPTSGRPRGAHRVAFRALFVPLARRSFAEEVARRSIVAPIAGRQCLRDRAAGARSRERPVALRERGHNHLRPCGRQARLAHSGGPPLGVPDHTASRRGGACPGDQVDLHRRIVEA